MYLIAKLSMLNVIRKVLKFPQWLAFFAADNSIRYYQIGFRLDGQIKLTENSRRSPPEQGNVIVVLDQSIPFKRHSFLSNKQFSSQHAFNAMLSELFPFEPDEANLALITQDSETGGQERYFFAIKKQHLNELTDQVSQNISAVLVSAESKQAILDVFLAWLSRTPYMDLSARPMPFPVQHFLTGVYVLFFIAILLSSIVIANQGYIQHNQEKDDYFRQINLEAEPVLLKMDRTRAMQMAYDEIVQLSQHKSNQALNLLDLIYARAPEQTELSKITFENNELTIRGKGKQAEKWLRNLPFNIKKISIEASPSFEHFSVTYNLTETNVPAPLSLQQDAQEQ